VGPKLFCPARHKSFIKIHKARLENEKNKTGGFPP